MVDNTWKEARNQERVERKRIFLKALYKTLSVSDACKAAHISRIGAYRWRDQDPAFRSKWAEVWEAGIDRREQVFDRMALKGVSSKKYVYFPDGTARLVEETVRDSPSTTLASLQALRPDKWSKAGRQDAAPSVHIGAVNVLALSDQQLAQMIAEKTEGTIADRQRPKSLKKAEIYDVKLEPEEDDNEQR